MRISLHTCRHWLAKDPVAAVCLALGVFQIYVITWPDPRLIVWPDSIGYLGPAVDALEGGHFTHWRGRGFVYPLFLLGVLKVAPEPLAIVYAQRLLVVLTYAALALNVWLLTRFARRTSLAQPSRLTVLAAFWLLTYVTYPPVIGLAHAVMAESMFSLLLAIVLLCVLLVTLPEVSLTWRRGALAMAAVCNVTLALVKPHWIGAALLLPLLLIWLVPAGRRLMSVGWVLVPLLLALLAFGIPEKMLQQRYDAYTSKIFGPRSLFCNSADLIYDDLARDGADPATEPLRQLLEEIVTPTARAEARAAGWRQLGFDGDKCMYGAAGKWVAAKYAGDAASEAEYYWQAYLGALLRKPDYVLSRLGKQLWALAQRPFGKTDVSYPSDSRIVAEYIELRQFYRTWMMEYRDDLLGSVESPFGNYQRELKVLYFLAGILLLLSVLTAILRLVFNQSRAPGVTPVSRAFLAVLLLCLAINCLIAVVHTFDVSRYIAMQVPLFVLLGLLSSIVIFHRPPVVATSTRRIPELR